MRSCHSTNTAAQARRLCYFSLGVAPRAVTSCALAKLDVSDSAQRQRLRIVADILLDPSQLTGTSDNVIERFPVPHRASRIGHLVDLFR